MEMVILIVVVGALVVWVTRKGVFEDTWTYYRGLGPLVGDRSLPVYTTVHAWKKERERSLL